VSRRRRSNQRAGRDDYFGSLTPSLPPPEPLWLTYFPRRTELLGTPFLREVEDRRAWYPSDVAPATGYSPARTFSGRPARLRVQTPVRRSEARFRPLVRLSYPSARIGFQEPRDVVICVRRSRRREVLHALGVAGSRGLRRPRRNAFSAITCRR